MTFTEKLITVNFALEAGDFAGGGNKAEISGLRTSCHIENRGGANQSLMELAIYGLPLSMMNQLSLVGTQYLETTNNAISVSAGDANGMSLVFSGHIFSAYVDAQSMPQVAFRVKATPSTFVNTKPAPVLSFIGAVKASAIAQKIAASLGFTFENNGVETVVSNPYYASDGISQIAQLAEHCGFDFYIELGKLIITAIGHSRPGAPVLISPSTGLVGYPMFNQNQVIVRCAFNPNIRYGGQVRIQSDLTPACGTWKITNLQLDLESKVPHGKWFMIAECIALNSTTPDQ